MKGQEEGCFHFAGDQVSALLILPRENSHRGEAREDLPQAGADVRQHLGHVLR